MNKRRTVLQYKYNTILFFKNDLALIKLSNDIIFSKEVLPICLLGSKLFPDETGEVYVAGWGSVAEKDCTTGKYGPDPYTLCAPSFDYQTKSYTECFTTPSPSSNDLLCLKLANSKNLTIFPEPGYTQTDILNKNNQILTTCFNFPMSNASGPYGWCETCKKDTMQGQPGYCGSSPLNINEERSIPKSTKGWGYCDKQCSSDGAVKETLLQEVQLELLSAEDCKNMKSLSSKILDIELCAAKQVGTFLLKLCFILQYLI